MLRDLSFIDKALKQMISKVGKLKKEVNEYESLTKLALSG
ncbi:hypothetical protein IPA_03840 [Ignicoccus pacificus DSM 13166]|uniref:Uncharacterized protein n=1 Tax=Ignicoccus pacificus DSM 13166 TaxID=940294 RepID=A0A977KB05_9CREN|nr:hypothetical protein IPA_03840 [Ignicoccus pacificus DSM 13166]